MVLFLLWNTKMVFLFSKQDIATAVGIPEREAVEFLRLKLFQYGITVSGKSYSVKAVVDLLWELNMNQQFTSKTKFDAMFGAWASSFREVNKQAILKYDQSDVIQVEIL